MQTSSQGIAQLELEEGVVLKAYRDAVGAWTIGGGLTAASGVVKPKAGMVITRAEADDLMRRALALKYEPSVRSAMTTSAAAPKQNEFDAGILFHWNTGAIARASWVRSWRAKAPAALIRSGLMAWNKGGGKVLPGLTARRSREADMLLDGKYRGAAPIRVPLSPNYARWSLDMSAAEKNAAMDGFSKLGFKVGLGPNPLLMAVVEFQRTYDLTPDGVVGRATLSTLQRQLDARSKAKTVAVVAAAPAATSAVPQGASDITDQILALPYVEPVLIGAAALYVLWFLYRRRDTVAATINPILPRAAALLRSF